MPWFKVDDKLHGHRKTIRAGEAMALWVVAGSWSADQLTDGFVPDYVAARLMPNGEDMAERLVDVGLWSPDSCGDDTGWRFNDWDEYQPTRDEVEARRQRDRQRKSSQNRAQNGRYATNAPRGSQTESDGNPDGFQPSRPDPTRTQTSRSSRKRADRATRIPDGWTPKPEPDLVEAVGGQRQADRELDRFRDYWTAQAGQKGRKVDWQATWRNWLRRAADNRQPPGSTDPPKPRHLVVGSPEWEARRAEELRREEEMLGA